MTRRSKSESVVRLIIALAVLITAITKLIIALK